jgi:hypothetical protein
MRNSEQFTITQSTQQSSQRFCLQFGGKRSCLAMAVCAAGMFAFAWMATAQGQLSTSPKAGAPSFAMPANGNVPGNGNVPAEPQKLNSQLDQQPQPPVIDFHQGSLTIQAANSSLRAILDDLQRRTGTRIDGLSRDERIYGVYGPGNAETVLAALLDGTGYNVIISGRNADGAPREINLSQRTAAQSMPQTRGMTQAAAEADDSDADDSTPTQTFGPPPTHTEPVAPANGASPQQIRTPQQMLQQLQQMRQQQQQQSPQ